MKITFLSICTILTFASCHFNSQYIDRVADKEDAEKITTRLYDLLKTNNYNETTDLFSKKFYEVTSKEKLFEIFTTTQDKLGDLKDTKIESWKTNRIEGSYPSANYLLVYKNKHEKSDSKESITLTKEPDGEIRIIGYNISSDGFLNIK